MITLPSDYTRWLRAGALIWSGYLLLLMISDWLLATGLSNQEIAKELHLSKGTVRNHISAIYRKLEVNDRMQAALIAIRHGLAT